MNTRKICAGIGAIALIGGLAACGSSASSSSSASATPSATPSASATLSATPSASASPSASATPSASKLDKEAAKLANAYVGATLQSASTSNGYAVVSIRVLPGSTGSDSVDGTFSNYTSEVEVVLGDGTTWDCSMDWYPAGTGNLSNTSKTPTQCEEEVS